MTARKIVFALALAATTAGFFSGPAQAEPRKLRIADSFPGSHYLVRLLLQPWMAEVTKRTDGEITFEHFPSQQLGKAGDMLALTQMEVADIGYVAPAYVSDKMVASEVAMLPGAFDTSCQGTRAYLQVARNGVVGREDYTPNRIRLLLAIALPQYQILTTKAPVLDEPDVKGVKLRSTGGAQDLTLRTIGAIPVRMAAPETYEALSRGTLDGVLFPLDSVVAYDIAKLLKHSTANGRFGSFIVAYSIGDKAWAKLSPKVQQVMMQVADEVNASACVAVEQQDAEIRQKLQGAGIQFLAMPDALEKKFATRLEEVSTQWAKGLDARGKKGTEALAEFRAALQN